MAERRIFPDPSGIFAWLNERDPFRTQKKRATARLLALTRDLPFHEDSSTVSPYHPTIDRDTYHHGHKFDCAEEDASFHALQLNPHSVAKYVREIC